MIDLKKVEEYDKFWRELHYLRYPMERSRMGLFRKASVIKKKTTKLPDAEEKIYDVIVGGGGPSGTLFASMLAQKGHSVLLVEKNAKHECGSTWNLSRSEFDDLKSTEVLSDKQFEELIAGEFMQGVFRLWDDTIKDQKEMQIFDLLNLSMNEDKYFELLTEKPNLNVELPRLELRLGTRAALKCITKEYAFVELTEGNNSKFYKTRLFLDATGWTSLLARTVNYGRVVESWYNMIGIHSEKKIKFEKDKDGKPVGLICMTYENEIKTRAGMVQPILERFTDFDKNKQGYKGDVIYYFTRTSKPVPLAPMFEDMEKKINQILPGYDSSQVDKTYYGHAAGYYQPGFFASRFNQLSAGDRTLMVGVAAQQYSGLTGCGFGCLARNAGNICGSIDKALKNDNLSFKVLQKIDIDPRERASQSITDLYAGSMELDPYEEPGTVNRDWNSFLDIGRNLDLQTKADVFKDKIRFKTLNQMIMMSARNMSVIDSLFRNNHGNANLVVTAFVKGYLRLLYLELQCLLKRRKRKYLIAGVLGFCAFPYYLLHVLRFFIKSRNVGK